MSDASFAPRSAFHGLLPRGDSDVGVRVADRDGVGMATVMVRSGHRRALRAALQSTYQLDLRDGPTVSMGQTVTLVGVGADSWLAIASDWRNGFRVELASALAETASISDQSDGYGLLRIRGPMAVEALSRLLPIDLHESAFPPRSSASTIAAHIPLIVWRLNVTTFDLAVFRSYAASFMHALGEAARPFGLGQEPPGPG